MLVEVVNHPVAKTPQQKQGGDQRKREEQVFPVNGGKKTALGSRV
jgi:hypothetical protein